MNFKKSFNLDDAEDSIILNGKVFSDQVLNLFRIKKTRVISTKEIIRNIAGEFEMVFILTACLSTLEDKRMFLKRFSILSTLAEEKELSVENLREMAIFVDSMPEESFTAIHIQGGIEGVKDIMTVEEYKIHMQEQRFFLLKTIDEVTKE